MAVEPIDTSNLGPIRFDQELVSIRADVVRVAIRDLRRSPHIDPESDHALALLSMNASDVVLAALARLIRNG